MTLDRTPPPAKKAKVDKNELKYYGVHACRALFEHSRERIIRAYVVEEKVKEWGDLFKWCASVKKAYHVVNAADLEKISSSVHHEGICILAKAPEVASDKVLLDELFAEERVANPDARKDFGPILIMDQMQNPHNIGSLIRTCAHFGIVNLCFKSAKNQTLLTPALTRVAQGGLEHVRLFESKDLTASLRLLRKIGYKLIATSSHSPSCDLHSFKFKRKTMIVFGNEVHGIDRKTLQQADEIMEIPGSGAVESLNVSIACGAVLSEYTRQLRFS